MSPTLKLIYEGKPVSTSVEVLHIVTLYQIVICTYTNRSAIIIADVSTIGDQGPI